MKTTTHNTELIQYAIDQLDNITPNRVYGCDLHHELFNTDYFIIGYHNAENWLTENVGVFQAINDIKEYEQRNFGEVSTDLSSSEKVVNMYAYIKGEEILGDCETLRGNAWDNHLTEECISNIREELENMLK